MGKVSIVKTDTGIKQGLIKALDLLGGLDSFIGQNEKVMLKPNLNFAIGLTNINITESLLQLLQDFGVNNIFMAESTFGNSRNTENLFNETGYAGLAKRYGIELVNLNASEPVEIKVKSPLVADTLSIASEVFEADKIINLPNMKVHYATGITLCLKNLKGMLVGREKRRFHEIGLEDAIVDLNNTIKPHLNIADCISCMERMGPFGGDLIDLNLIMAGADSGEVDFIGSRIMGFDIIEIKHLKKFIELNNIDTDEIQLLGENIEDVKRPFVKVRFNDIVPKEITMHNTDACSSCVNAFLLSCSFIAHNLKTNVDVFLGSLNNDMISSADFKIVFGNCCKSVPGFTEKIKGCPPLPFRLTEILKKYDLLD